MSACVVCLTGGIGSGKSRIADLFVERGAALVDTDAIARELTGPGGAAMPALLAEFGEEAADASGALDRAAMRRLAFADPERRRRLESILHPLIREEAARRCAAATAPYVILAVPLLVESGGYRDRCRRILVVDCPEATQIARVMVRDGCDEAAVRAIMATQATRAERLATADDVIVNDGDFSALAAQVDALHRQYLQLSATAFQVNS
ncbi:MAG: dephospho-CoA kinase [Betaproteobacteria bacterium]|nr:dephospho-CoA kinase [Betaproteobacteria bacterium]MCL2886409.1 dephospho-CoA kinase [Betaproteobacteria bacterium]